ncbi:MAG TPA: adenylyl-sulfate kinase [Burkholderiaceae bacterium]|nr:adenylyl-sulfate kinase [Burkholderiaceae bacterium]
MTLKPLTKTERAVRMGQRPVCIWLTGIPAAGKSTIARELERRLHAAGRHSYVLDGDVLRAGLNRDLGFSQAERAENVRRNAEVARLMVDAGLIVICAFISPYRDQRRIARSLFDAGDFLEVFLDAPVPVCEARDPKGNYARARRGEIPNFTGIDGSYEPPESAELQLDTEHLSINECVTRILQLI